MDRMITQSRRASHAGGAAPGPPGSHDMERKYSVPSNPDARSQVPPGAAASEDLHAWSIYRQNLNSDFTDSALGSTDKSPLPYGNFQLRDTTVQSILAHPRYGPKSALGSNMYTYLKFGLPRVFPPNHPGGSHRSATPQHQHHQQQHQQQQHYRTGGPATMQRPLRGPGKGHGGPRGARDGSSGYDSSDNETAHHQYKQSRKYRSDPDFRMQNIHVSYQQHPAAAAAAAAAASVAASRYSGTTGRPPPGGGPPVAWGRNKSVSEANLLAGDVYNTSSYHRRNSIADFGHDGVPDHVPLPLRPVSKAGSEMSVRRPPQTMPVAPPRGGEYLLAAHDQDVGPAFVYPHLQLRSLEVVSTTTKGMLLLQNVSFEIRGGEILAVMATSEVEGTGLLDCVAGLRAPVSGDIILNGQNITRRQLRSRVAYAQNEHHLCQEMTAHQTLRFHYDLKRPTEKLDHLKIGAVDRINVLIEDLGLDQVRNTKVENMTTSEKRRLNVACHLLLDTDIVVLDQPTRGMDIFDTFFLVEYLRQWATGGTGRAVILTLHPPTYEIFTMLSRILLVSAGRTMYSGRRRDMLQYFAMVEYPCPSFKNPSDYYLDLVTLDDLSAEAMLESSQRIEQLADIYRRKQEPMSEPGPPTTLPPASRNTSCISQALVLFMKSMFYTQPGTFVRWTSLFLMSVTMSLVLGAVYWDVPNTDAQLTLDNRLGYHYAVMSVAAWPMLIALTLSELRTNRATVERDIRDGLYGRFTYIFTKMFVNVFPSLFIWLVYLVPCYSMSGLYMQGPTDYNGFYIYIGYMLLYLSCQQMLLTALMHLVPLSNLATLLAATFVTATYFAGGYTLHLQDLPNYLQWLRYVSPSAWTLPALAGREYTQQAITGSSATTLCRNKQVQHQDIIVQLPCPPPNGTQVLQNFGYLHSVYPEYIDPATAMAIFYVVCLVVAFVGFLLGYCWGRAKSSNRSETNRP